MPPAVRAKAREHHLLVLTKANSRSTVHRAGYLDYIGVKSFDAGGKVVGERRFLGLFTAAAYSESVTAVPVLRHRKRRFDERGQDGLEFARVILDRRLQRRGSLDG